MTRLWLPLLGFVASLGVVGQTLAVEPVLFRLHFHVPDERMDEFARLYETELRPMLQAQGLRESAATGRPAPGFFTRLFEFDSVARYLELSQAPPDAQLMAWQAAQAERFGWTEPWQASGGLYSAWLPEPVEVEAGPSRGRWVAYDASDGRSRSSLAGGMFVHHVRSLWVQSDRGVLSRFDGQSWTVQAIPGLGRHWRYQRTDHGGSHWFVRADNVWETGTELAVWDSRSARTFTADRGLDVGPLSAFVVDRQGVLWNDSDAGPLCFDGTRTYSPTGVSGRVLFADGDGRLWVRSGSSLLRHDGESAAPLRGRIPAEGDVQGAQDPSGRLWLGTDAGLFVVDGDSVVARSELSGQRIRRLLADRRGDLWVALDLVDSGVLHVRVRWPEALDVTRYTTVDGLVGNGVREIVEDREGGIWVATNGGASRFEPASGVRSAPRARSVAAPRSPCGCRGSGYFGGSSSLRAIVACGACSGVMRSPRDRCCTEA